MCGGGDFSVQRGLLCFIEVVLLSCVGYQSWDHDIIRIYRLISQYIKLCTYQPINQSLGKSNYQSIHYTFPPFVYSIRCPSLSSILNFFFYRLFSFTNLQSTLNALNLSFNTSPFHPYVNPAPSLPPFSSFFSFLLLLHLQSLPLYLSIFIPQSPFSSFLHHFIHLTNISFLPSTPLTFLLSVPHVYQWQYLVITEYSLEGVKGNVQCGVWWC